MQKESTKKVISRVLLDLSRLKELTLKLQKSIKQNTIRRLNK